MNTRSMLHPGHLGWPVPHAHSCRRKVRLPARAWAPLLALAMGLALVHTVQGDRLTLSLDGRWEIDESRSPTNLPTAFARTVPVPGLANLARPPFPDVDAFLSREHLANRIRAKLAPDDWLTNYWAGKVDQDRNYFWYRRTFRAPARRDVALLRIAKAQFGTAVWLNGRPLGEYSGCFTASYFRLDPALRWQEDNTLVIRIGAHPAVLPDTYPTGSDFEKIRWTPGIYDRVSLICCDNPTIASVQIAPRVAPREIVVQTRVKNHGAAPAPARLGHRVRASNGGRQLAALPPESVLLGPGEERVFMHTIPLPGARLWSPEDPFLHVVETSTGGDTLVTRFGLREFRFDAGTGRAHLNGEVYYLRGSNITLHRFFEDPLCGDLPWRERWVRELLGAIPKRMHWNYFRFCIGPVPERWFELCDELGLLVQNEFPVWTGGPGWYQGYARTHDADEMIRQYRDWMRDHWNHPSVAVWDANNETKDDQFGQRIIPAVRPLDLSQRPWENSYNPPADRNDPVEYHPYLMSGGYFGKLAFKMADLETMDGRPGADALPSPTNPVLINEYGWLWLNRDGSPTRLTTNVYAQLIGTHVSARERLDHYAYLLGAKTEFWRARRHYAGVVHFVYLTCSYPGVYTADHFQDVTRLKLDPAFADYLGEAFKPLGVYVNFFQPTLAAGATRAFPVTLINDDPQPRRGQLTLALETRDGRTLVRTQQDFALAARGAQDYALSLTVPQVPGAAVLRAIARASGPGAAAPTVCRRWLSIAE